ncbi:class I SAM-dependent methyltransferase [Umezawaea endophytica]|uniref:Methyltransferase domain-containing protein n=1 Tax=Umezawaea endophytica TaxID=1654476 RepID=A0A9X2VMH9_9PSEU|nr:class I SAM-dependent methyltransferase [Umezawaea endophytica]MCS7479255.1 methyltransferase domain-containing protein [Umezawaea endophytica]
MTTETWLSDTRTSYDTVAADYADLLRGAMEDEPHLRAALAVFAELVRTAGGGPVGDIGCGPGRLTADLRDLGLDAFGVDLSPAMIDVARRDHPDLRFEVGSMTDLDLADASAGGLFAWFSLIHVPDHEVPGVLAHFHRALRPGCPLLVAFHVGDETVLKTTGYGGHPMNVRIHRRLPATVSTWLRDAGFTVDAETVLHKDGRQGAIIYSHRS